MDSFDDKLAHLVTKEITQSLNDPEKMAMIVERLAAGLGFAIALAAKGDAKTIETLLMGAENHVAEVAADRAPSAKLISEFLVKKQG